MIKTFADNATADLLLTGKSRRITPDIQKSGLRRLKELNAATSLNDLRGVGGSLEEVVYKGIRRHSLRINDKYRLYFRWEGGHAYDVEIDDHKKK